VFCSPAANAPRTTLATPFTAQGRRSRAERR